MKLLMSILLMLSSLQVLQSPEEMYGSYDKDGKYRKMREKMEQISERLEKEEEAREENKNWILGFSLTIGLFPFVFIGAQVIRGKTWETNLSGTIQSLGTALGGRHPAVCVQLRLFLSETPSQQPLSVCILPCCFFRHHHRSGSIVEKAEK